MPGLEGVLDVALCFMIMQPKNLQCNLLSNGIMLQKHEVHLKKKFLSSESVPDDNLEMQTTDPQNNTINVADPRNDALEKCRPPNFTS